MQQHEQQMVSNQRKRRLIRLVVRQLVVPFQPKWQFKGTRNNPRSIVNQKQPVVHLRLYYATHVQDAMERMGGRADRTGCR